MEECIRSEGAPLYGLYEDVTLDRLYNFVRVCQQCIACPIDLLDKFEFVLQVYKTNDYNVNFSSLACILSFLLNLVIKLRVSL